MSDTTTFDDLLEEVGSFGKYQIFVTILLCIAGNLMNAWTFFDLVFMLYKPEHHCQKWSVSNTTWLDLVNLNSTKEECELEGSQVDGQEVYCEKWHYDKKYFEQTLITQWDLACGRDPLSRHIMVVFTAASILGLGVMSFIQDRYGRRIAFIISVTLTVIGSGFAVLAPTLGAFVAIRSIQQTQMVVSYNIPFVWAQEFVGPAKRTLVNFFMVLSYATGTVSLGLVAYACRTWVQLGLITSVPFVLLFSYWFLIDESPRWLLSVGRVEEATKIIEKMVRWNGKTLKSGWLPIQIKAIADSSIRERDHESAAGLGVIFRAYHLRTKVILLTVVWVANSTVYNTMAFNAAKLGNMYVAYIIQAAVEAPACIFNLLLSNRIGRMPLIILAMFFSTMFSALCIPAYTGEWDEWYVTIFAALSKFGVCISWNVLYQASGEMYPTAFRATGIAVSIVVSDATIGAMPYILETSTNAQWLPMCILAILTFVGACCVCVLPETMDIPMPQTVEEAEKISRVETANLKTHVKNLMKPCTRRKVGTLKV